MVWISRSEIVWPTSDVFTSFNVCAVTVTPSSVVAAAAPPAGTTRSSVPVDATVSVTVCCVPGPASTSYVPGGNPTIV